MSDSLRERTWAFLCATFPERQIYIRSNGRVQFFIFGPLMQTMMTGITLLFLGWVAFTSVNVIFKDRIIAANNHRYRQMQSSYEARVADLQLSYDELNNALVTTEDHVKSVIDDFQTKQNALSEIIEHKQKLETSLGMGGQETSTALPAEPNAATALAAPLGSDSATDGDALDGQDVSLPGPPPASGSSSSSAVAPAGLIPFLPKVFSPKAPTPKASVAPGVRKESFLNGTVGKLIGLFGRRRTTAVAAASPVIARINEQLRRVSALDTRQLDQLTAIGTQIDAETVRLRQALKMIGLKTERIVTPKAEGGPLVPLPSSFSANSEGAYQARFASADDSLGDFTELVNAMTSVPLVQPVTGAQFEQSSAFGARRDPFTKQLSFHSGLDFSGPAGSPVRATAPGVVVYAGLRGAYGNTVEIDHGHGIRTRYGHLRSILVSVGSKVAKDTTVGRLGSTGRSTGPHVHYEVWYDDAARNPRNFLKAGHYVLEE